MLPSLPVPPLHETLQRLLSSVRALSSDAEFAVASKLVEEFARPDGVGDQLQALLEKRAEACAAMGTSWLAQWWLKHAYLIWRCPVAITSNYSYALLEPRDRVHPTQLARASTLIEALAHFKWLVNTGQVPPETRRGKPLDMSAYSHGLYGHCRVPQRDCDVLELHDESLHCVLLRRGNAFSVPVLRPMNGGVVPVAEIASRVRWVLEQPLVQRAAPCALTGGDRRRWAEARAALMADARNRVSLAAVESALFVVCLDDDAPADEQAYYRALWHGRGNRWFDKMQLVVLADGAAGLNIEHSPVDGSVTLPMTEAALLRAAAAAPLPPVAPAPAHALPFTVPDAVCAAATAAASELAALAASVCVQPAVFGDFGRRAMAQQRVSPDGLVQLAFQLAQYRVTGRLVAVYESAQTRMFRHGRTECIRSCTEAAAACVRAFDCTDISTAEKRAMIQHATDAHARAAQLASQGLGVDRHLLGLRLMAEEHGLPPLALFDNPAVRRSCTWHLSTSQLPSPLVTVTFGAVVDDGWGIWYGIDDSSVRMVVTSGPTAPVNACGLVDRIAQALRDLMAVLHVPVSRL